MEILLPPMPSTLTSFPKPSFVSPASTPRNGNTKRLVRKGRHVAAAGNSFRHRTAALNRSPGVTETTGWGLSSGR